MSQKNKFIKSLFSKKKKKKKKNIFLCSLWQSRIRHLNMENNYYAYINNQKYNLHSPAFVK